MARKAASKNPCHMRGNSSTEAGRGTSGCYVEGPARANSTSLAEAPASRAGVRTTRPLWTLLCFLGEALPGHRRRIRAAGAGGIPLSFRTLATVLLATRWSRFLNAPWIRLQPPGWIFRRHPHDKRRDLLHDPRTPRPLPPEGPLPRDQQPMPPQDVFGG